MSLEAGNNLDSNSSLVATQSLCPICFKKIDAEIVSQSTGSYMVKRCPEHGTFQTLVWSGSTPMEKWIVKKERTPIRNPQTPLQEGCPYDCGLCGEHRQHTCTALIEVTQNCNLHCSFCFANSGSRRSQDPSVEEINRLYQSTMKASGGCNIQLSGGEPTLRDDLPRIIRNGKELGFRFIQVNTNGIRLSQDEAYVEELKSAGLDSVFLQFDGTDDEIYKKLRGRSLLEKKIKAIENCGKYGIGVVLVPTLVPGVNTGNIGGIIRFALRHISAVRGVHFQPVSYFGRVPKQPEDKDRLMLAELMDEIEKQTDGNVRANDLKPPQCENSLCSFHGNFLSLGDGKLAAVSKNSGCCKSEEGAIKAKSYVSRNWAGRLTVAGKSSPAGKKSDWDVILDRVHSTSFSISAMAFQDIWNIDLNRVKDCCIHVVSPDGRLIPFCLYNVTDSEGNALYRDRNRWST